jgi:trk system potassium uptake protein TrkH
MAPVIVEIITLNIKKKSLYPSSLEVFLVLDILLIFTGLSLVLANKNTASQSLSIKDGLLLSVLSWILIGFISSLPFKFSYLQLSYTDAFFESMSGLTTTGASIIEDLSILSYSLNLWRVLLGWFGSVGIIFTAIILIPSMQGGTNIFKTEAFETFDNPLDKAKNLAFGILGVYAFLTFLAFILLVYVAKLGLFDSLIHALSAISTTGFSNKNLSVADLNNPVAEILLMCFMLTGGIPYIYLYYLVFFKSLNLFTDTQVRAYFKLLFIVIATLTIWLVLNEGVPFLTSLKLISFASISMLTGTGLTIADHTTFGTLPTMVFLFLMIIGGCSGSKSAGLKIFRLQIVWFFIKQSLSKIYLKNHIKIPMYNNKPLSYDASTSVFTYIMLYFATVAVCCIILSSLDIDFITAFSASVASVSNVGPGLGQMVGPSGNYYSLPSLAKITLVFAMLLGRLEIMIILAIFSKKFWLR